MPTKKKAIYIYVTPEEHSLIKASSSKTRLSMSNFAKKACLGQNITSKVDSEAVGALIKINADMGRLGGLMKLWLSNDYPETKEIRKLLNDLIEAKEDLKKQIMKL